MQQKKQHHAESSARQARHRLARDAAASRSIQTTGTPKQRQRRRRRQQHGVTSNARTLSLHADARADLLLGHRLATPNTGITAGTSTPPPLTLLSLRNWQPVKGNGIHTNLRTTVDDALANCNADTERRQTKIQKEHALFEASVVTLAQYFQEGIHARNKLFWKQKQATS